MNTQDRKEALRAYKEQAPARGVFAMKNAVTGQAWVGASLDLAAARNNTLFQLRLGQHRNAALQAEWQVHGSDALAFEVLETLADDENEFGVRDALKVKTRDWATRLAASVLLP